MDLLLRVDTLNRDTFGDNFPFHLELMELAVLGESELDGRDYLFAIGILCFEGLLTVLNVLSLNSDGHEHGADFKAVRSAVGLSPSLSHTG